MKHGEQFVTISLTMLMHQSYVVSWDFLKTVIYYYNINIDTKLFDFLVDPLAASGAAFGQGTGLVLINGLQCFGNETSLIQCPGADFVSSSCPHSRDIGVTCQVRQCK